VRIARTVSHPNVCRVYDVGEADGQHFLSMEYVDGEDLASLLRRIGHVPKEKAIQIARQLCAGLAAAHEAGVLHRDLKPANVMIDGRGRARITDFGLAALAERLDGAAAASGTPAYMAPEQRAGKEVTARSDLYALGLVLYELFTGKPALRSATSTWTSPSSLVEGFDPAVERVILRCLEPDPAQRPASALSVAAALPGGDPLAAALAAGETPSPEMVAEAGHQGAVGLKVSWGALAVFAAALATFVALTPHTSLLGRVPLDKPPQFLEERARELLAVAGLSAKPADHIFSFEPDTAYLDHLAHAPGGDVGRWRVLRTTPPAAILFWYRQSPEPMARRAPATVGEWMSDPPNTTPGMAQVALDPKGRLVALTVVPPPRAPADASAEPDWTALLQATGVDLATLHPVPPGWAPPTFADRRSAWTGSWPSRPDLTVRIEAASVGGRPVSLRVHAPWSEPAEEARSKEGFWTRTSRVLNAVLFVAVLVIAGVVALRNVRRGRGDRRGALRLALYLGAARMLWLLGAHHVASAAESDLFVAHFSYAMQRVGLAYVFYLAVEPYARRLWPGMLVSWVRVLEGRLRDPLVGRDLLLGCGAGAVWACMERLQIWLPGALGGAPGNPAWSLWTFEALRGPTLAFVSIVALHTLAFNSLFTPFTLFVIFRLLLRRSLLAAVAVTLVGLVLFTPTTGNLVAYFIGIGVLIGLYWTVLFRAGFLALATMVTVSTLLSELPITPHPAAWYAGATLLSLAAIAAPALYGFWTSRAGRPLFQDAI
ncbi:MAG TPA: serine/threonine-protein kinase, partial [Candidatus Polarisedimenticolaceae bacterium]|nr:serine/threonine-protein kinase [Candidatus Polarisedimenticolaceae bacterium]